MEQMVARRVDRAALARDAASYLGAGVAGIFAIGCLIDHMPIGALVMVAAIAVAIPPTRRALAVRGVPRVVRIILPIVLVFAGCLAIGAEAEGASKSTPSRDQHTVTPAQVAKPDAEPAAKPDQGLATSQTKLFWTHFQQVASPCDAASNKAAKSFDDLNAVRAYDAASDAADACDGVSSTLNEIEAPEAYPAEAQTAFTDAMGTCQSAYANKAGAFRKEMAMLDDMRPSTIHDAKEAMESANAGVMLCLANLFNSADKAGVSNAVFAAE